MINLNDIYSIKYEEPIDKKNNTLSVYNKEDGSDISAYKLSFGS